MRTKITDIFSTQFAQDRDVGAKDRDGTEGRLDDGDPKTFFAAREDQRVCQPVEIGYDRIRS